MRKYTISSKVVAVVTSAAFFCATAPEQARAQCVNTFFNKPVANSAACSCTLGFCSPSAVIVGHAGYNSCVSANGYNSCLTPDPNTPPYDYYDTTPCENETSYTGYAECGIAVLAAGGVDAVAILGPCLVGGVFTLGAGCVAAIATISATAALTISTCKACNLAPCEDPSSGTTATNVTPNGADTTSGACPPA